MVPGEKGGSSEFYRMLLADCGVWVRLLETYSEEIEKNLRCLSPTMCGFSGRSPTVKTESIQRNVISPF